LPATQIVAAEGQLIPLAKNVQLNFRDSVWQLLVDHVTDEATIDRTHAVQFQTSNDAVAIVSQMGVVQAVGDGNCQITLRLDNLMATVDVTVLNCKNTRPTTFERDVIPILSRFGCNGSGCHGKAEGQNGFKLSVFGFDPDADFNAITQEGRGRRIFPAAAEQSLLLQKVSGQMPHGGGVRIESERAEFDLLREWVVAGALRATPDTATVDRIEITPADRLMAFDQNQVTQVTAFYSDGLSRDVTNLVQFHSNRPAIGNVDADGIVITGTTAGTAAVMATFMGHVDVLQITVPQPGESIDDSGFDEFNYIDRFVNRNLKRLNIGPSNQADDATFLRRVYLDLIGTLPSAEESRQFLGKKDPKRRQQLVAELMERPEFADYWALKWADLLHVNRRALGHKNANAYYRWIHRSFAENMPLDQFAKEIVTAEGALRDVPAGNLFKVVTKPNEVASALSQVFMGVRIECAQCHHHPFDRWGQSDYYGMQAFFTQVSFKKSDRGELLLASGKQKTNHPRTGEAVFAHGLGEAMPEEEMEGDRRKEFASWLTSESNPWFARNMTNRVWGHFMGRGIVEPVDDLRLTNPPSNPELLEALAAQFKGNQYDLRKLILDITASAAYQRSNEVLQTNRGDQRNYSRFAFKSLPAEVLLDAVCQVTGVPEKFDGVPAGSRAIQLWDSEVPHEFLRLFGRPIRVTACECERVSEPTVSQVLHAFNSPRVQSKLSRPDGTIAKLCRKGLADSELIDELYLSYFSRLPDEKEREAVLKYVKSRSDRTKAFEDVAWSMLNSLEFLFNH
jgi:hypothetical protein